MTVCLLTHQLFPGYHKFLRTVVNHTSTSELKTKQLSKTLGQIYNIPVAPGSQGTEMSSQINVLPGYRQRELLPKALRRIPPAVLKAAHITLGERFLWIIKHTLRAVPLTFFMANSPVSGCSDLRD